MNLRAQLMCVVVCSLAATPSVADSPDSTRSTQGNLDVDIALILDDPLAESEYGENVRCLFAGNYRNVEVLDAGHLLFWGYNGRVWLNQLRVGCLGLTDDKVLQFDMTGRGLCALDRFQGLDRAARGGIPSAMCGLQRFELITVEQAKQLKSALARRLNTPASVRKSTPETTGD